jgi:hypothetical protein
MSLRNTLVRSYSMISFGRAITMRWLRVSLKLNSRRLSLSGVMAASSLGWHSVLRSRMMMVSEVLMKRTFG